MQQQNIHVNDEIVINQFLQMFRNIFINISIFILCISLFMNPHLLVNTLLFMSIFLLVKNCLSYLFDENKEKNLSLPPSIETEIKIFDESELLKDRIRKLKRENYVLKDKLERTDRKHKKRNVIPPFTFEPFKINVDFLEKENGKDEDEVEVKENFEVEVKENFEDEVKENFEVEDEVKDEDEDEVKDEDEDEVEVEVEVEEGDKQLSLDLERIITEAINDMIKSSEMFKDNDDGFSILSPPIPNTPVDTDEDI